VLVVLWIAFVAFMAVRMATLWWRLRGDAWAITGTTTR